MKSLHEDTNLFAFFSTFRTTKNKRSRNLLAVPIALWLCDFGSVSLYLLMYMKNWDSNVYMAIANIK